MNWDLIHGTWRQVLDKTREKWGKLTADDLDIEAGRRERSAGQDSKCHGMARNGVDNEMSEKQRQAIDLWFAKD